MYIKKVVLKNVRCFGDFTLEFDKKEKSCLIVGDNGQGKSTLLRSIAMSLCDISSAAALFRELRGKFVRKRSGEKPSYIQIYLQDDGRKTYIVQTEFHTIKGKVLERLGQKVWLKVGEGKAREIGQDEFPWNRIFAVGYGAGGRTLGTESIESYAAVDGVYTLFRYDEPLQNPELALRRAEAEGRKRGKGDVLATFLELLRGLLNLTERDEVCLTKKGIEVRGPWGQSQLETLGDGYKSTIIWVLDFIGRRLLYGRTLDPEQMTGVVLLDEVEQHLHPKWQLNVMSLIREAFPKIQLIATTHSPLVVSGCKYCKIRKVTEKQDEVGNAYGWLAEDVYREVMDLSTSRPVASRKIIEELRDLQYKGLFGKLAEKDGARMRELEDDLQRLPSTDPIVLTSKLENMTKKLRKARGANK